MEAEITALFGKETFEVINFNQVSPEKDIIKSTWVLKWKQRPDGITTKLKARFYIQDNLQKLPNNESTYAPIVDWDTVRLLFTLSVTHNLPTKQVDFCNVFVQSHLPRPIFLELPQGFTENSKVWKVNKSLYKDERAPKLWFRHLRNNLLNDDVGCHSVCLHDIKEPAPDPDVYHNDNSFGDLINHLRTHLHLPDFHMGSNDSIDANKDEIVGKSTIYNDALHDRGIT
jgi:hypothetical protein